MFDEFLSRATALRSQDRPFATAIVVSYQPPVSGKPGDKAIIEADGSIWGWIGGGCVQTLVIREALKAIEDGNPRLVRIAPSPTSESEERTVNYTMTCQGGGALDIYIEPVLPKPQILIIGRSPVAQTLCKLGKTVGYRITVVSCGADRETFPDADIRAEELDLQHLQITPETYVVVSTQGEQDEEALEQASRTNASYISFAEIVQMRKTKTAWVEQKEIAGGELAKSEAKDPVCGMLVDEPEPKYISDYRGEMYYFCCAGCKQAFDKQPEAYLSSAVSDL